MSTRTNRAILTQYSGLTLLSGRTLPTLPSDLKVVALVKRYYKTPVDVIEGVREALKKRLPDGWTANEFPPDLTREWQTFLDGTQEMPEIPDNLKLTKDDMPKALKTGLGEANRQGVADLILALGNLYKDEPVDEPVAE